jgi:hypothetical protein
MIHCDDIDPAMRYESLYRYAFDCKRFGDPWENADQSNYGVFMKDDLSEAKVSLYRILHKLIFDNFKYLPESNKLIEIEKEINKITTQWDAVKIIDNAIQVIEEWRYKKI